MNKIRQEELFQEIKDKNDIISVISEYISLKKTGRSLVGLCPFHSEKTPSFNVNQEKQFYYCFGCGAGGDVFNFIMKMENLDFIGAARRLAERAGIDWPEVQPVSEEDRKKNELLKINKFAAAFFHQCLLKTSPGEVARRYLEKRQLQTVIWEKFNIGYAFPAWHNLTEALRKKGISLEQTESLGLIGIGENGYYDRFRDRVIFPIADPQGNVVGFGGRVLEQGEPKYLNSPENKLFHKGRFLYGMPLAKDSIRRNSFAIIVEGYMDVIQAHQFGFTHTVASLGTALTKEQARIIKRYTAEVVLAYDSDSAGQNATIRGMDILEEAGLNVRILRLPNGHDPDSFLREYGKEALQTLLDKAPGLTDFKISLALRKYNTETIEGKTKTIAEVIPLVASFRSNVTREYYIRQFSREIGVSENSIIAELERWERENRKKAPFLDRNLNSSYTKGTVEKIGISLGMVNLKELTPLKQAIFEAEKELLQLALQEYDKFERIKEELQEEDLSFPIWRGLFVELKKISLTPEAFQSGLTQLDNSLIDLVSSLRAEKGFKDDPHNLDDVLNRLKMLKLQEKIQTLNNEIMTGRNQSGEVITDSDLKEKVIEFTELKRKLYKEYPQFSAGV